LEKQIEKDFRHNEAVMARHIPFLRKEATEKEVAKEATKKVVVEKEDDNDDEEDQEA
jgi:hypothetical protein